MNPEAQAELDRILALSPEDLTESDRGFLQARRSYLTEEQRINFGITEGEVKAEKSKVKADKKE